MILWNHDSLNDFLAIGEAFNFFVGFRERLELFLVFSVVGWNHDARTKLAVDLDDKLDLIGD